MRIGIREPLAAARTYYVRTDGNDANTGLIDSAAGAFRTIQRAVNEVAEDLDLGGYGVAIQVRSGTYQENVKLKPFLGTASVTLRGDNTTPANVVIAPSSGSCLAANAASTWIFEGFRVTSADSHGIACVAPLLFQNIEFGPCAGFHVYCATGADVSVLGAYRISGGASAHIATDSSGATVRMEGRAVTLVGTPAFSTAFVYAVRGSAVIAGGATFSASATGARYSAQSNAVVDTGGGGATFFPGSVAGNTATGGQYV